MEIKCFSVIRNERFLLLAVGNELLSSQWNENLMFTGVVHWLIYLRSSWCQPRVDHFHMHIFGQATAFQSTDLF
jgi:hypothetical protein